MDTGIICSPELRVIRPLLRRWISINASLAKQWKHERDVPWWYNERADISILAAAAWQAHGTAFEEYTERKRERRGRFREHVRYQGRVDLFFTLKNRRFTVEAKPCWPRCSSRASISFTKVHDRLDRAIKDAKKVRPYHSTRLAVLFVAPNFPPYSDPKLSAETHRWIDQLKTEFSSVDALAWVFPSGYRRNVWRGRAYPGLVILIQHV